jgi:uncharacterized C2H2 Zn-finger protein
MAKKAPISKRELRTSIALITLILGITILSSLLLLTQYWFVWLIVLASMFIVVGYFTASKDFYQCPSCDTTFRITAIQDFFAPHGITKGLDGELFEWKLLKCPQCNLREKCYRTQVPANA